MCLKPKNTYSRSEILDFLRQFDSKLLQINQVTDYERKRAEEYKEENKILNEQVDQQRKQLHEIEQILVKY